MVYFVLSCMSLYVCMYVHMFIDLYFFIICKCVCRVQRVHVEPCRMLLSYFLPRLLRQSLTKPQAYWLAGSLNGQQASESLPVLVPGIGISDTCCLTWLFICMLCVQAQVICDRKCADWASSLDHKLWSKNR